MEGGGVFSVAARIWKEPMAGVAFGGGGVAPEKQANHRQLEQPTAEGFSWELSPRHVRMAPQPPPKKKLPQRAQQLQAWNDSSVHDANHANRSS